MNKTKSNPMQLVNLPWHYLHENFFEIASIHNVGDFSDEIYGARRAHFSYFFILNEIVCQHVGFK